MFGSELNTFKGIPFAAPPFGANRLRTWTGPDRIRPKGGSSHLATGPRGEAGDTMVLTKTLSCLLQPVFIGGGVTL